jgi:ankyrin repeat protein
MVQDEDCRIPLHLAFQSEYASLRVVEFLFEKYPERAQSRSLFEELSLHYAVHHAQTSVEVVKFSIETYPNAVNVTDTDGMLSVHIACAANASLEVIQLSLIALMETNSITMDLALLITRGLPLYFYARSQNASAEILQRLLELYPGGVHLVEEFGMLPLHYACDSHHPARLEIIRILTEAAPHTVAHSEMYKRKNTNSAHMKLSQERR